MAQTEYSHLEAKLEPRTNVVVAILGFDLLPHYDPQIQRDKVRNQTKAAERGEDRNDSADSILLNVAADVSNILSSRMIYSAGLVGCHGSSLFFRAPNWQPLHLF